MKCVDITRSKTRAATNFRISVTLKEKINSQKRCVTTRFLVLKEGAHKHNETPKHSSGELNTNNKRMVWILLVLEQERLQTFA